MEPQPVAEPTPAPAPTRPVRAAAQKAADKKAAEAEAVATVRRVVRPWRSGRKSATEAEAGKSVLV